MLKDAGREKQSKKKQYKDIKCDNCRRKISVDDCIKIGDVDYIAQTNEYQIYCPECGVVNTVKKMR